jgi:hypothetical protein
MEMERARHRMQYPLDRTGRNAMIFTQSGAGNDSRRR